MQLLRALSPSRCAMVRLNRTVVHFELIPNMNATFAAAHQPSRAAYGRFPQGHYPAWPEPSFDRISSARTAPSRSPAPAPSSEPPARGTVIFRLDALAADRVKLAADFTGWETQAIDLRRREDGTWQVAVDLPRGEYSYRFLVDGHWRDDPQCREFESNPFGGLNAVVRVM